MKLNVWHFISNLGVNRKTNLKDYRYVVLSNRISFCLLALNTFLIAAVYLIFGYRNSIPYLITADVIYIVILFLNSRGYHLFGRFFISGFLPVATLLITLAIIPDRDDVADYLYYNTKIIILSSSVLPLVLFSYKEKWPLYSLLFINFLTLALYDPVQRLFGVGYFQTGGTDGGYELVNYFFIASFMMNVLSILFLKNISNKYEDKNVRLIDELNTANTELGAQNEKLVTMNFEVEKQNQELNRQSEEIYEANALIAQQKKALEKQNLNLVDELSQRNNELLGANKKLQSKNEELRQFSFALSHNLRSPVTSLKGLLELAEYNEDKEEIFRHVGSSVEALDEVITGLSEVLAISYSDKNKENLELKSIIEKAWKLVSVTKDDVILRTELKTETLYADKAFMMSILYNLLSNSAKYKDPNKNSFVLIKSFENRDRQYLEVSDNGLGMDMQKHKDDIFMIYKRFHEGVAGNGLGLYLVKTQVELMDGAIRIDSSVGKGMQVVVELPKVKP